MRKSNLMTVRSRLKAIIAEKNLERINQGLDELTIRVIAEDTGLSPSILSGLTTNRTMRVDYGTLNKLCKYFNVQPGDILVYIDDDK